MFPFDDHDRDVLAGLSFHAGRALPATLADTARAYGLPVGGLAFPATLDTATGGGQATDEVAQFGASLRQRPQRQG
jgi:hypothetical protein